jgi:hypothetical protein
MTLVGVEEVEEEGAGAEVGSSSSSIVCSSARASSSALRIANDEAAAAAAAAASIGSLRAATTMIDDFDDHVHHVIDRSLSLTCGHCHLHMVEEFQHDSEEPQRGRADWMVTVWHMVDLQRMTACQ